jgi:phosphatidylglycerol:prolipoprotein diacylglycerol transferase
MFPILFKIGDLSFSSLGVAVGLGFFIAFFIIWRRLKERGADEEKIVDAVLFSSLTGLIFSRVFFVFSHFQIFKFYLIRWAYFNRYPGFSYWGAIFGFLLGFYYFTKREKWPFFKMADELVFGLTVFSVLVHFGCLLDGSNLGAETGLFWGLFYPGDMVRRHPVSLFQAILSLLLWFYLLKIERIWRTWEWYKSKKEGFLILNFLIFSSLFEFLLAFLKPAGLYSSLIEKAGGLSVLLISTLWLFFRSGRKLKEGSFLTIAPAGSREGDSDKKGKNGPKKNNG